MIINTNLKKLRREVGLTQEEFAIKLEIKRSLLGAYEEGRAEVSNRVIETILRKGFLLKSDLYDFMFNSKMKPRPTYKFKKILTRVYRKTA